MEGEGNGAHGYVQDQDELLVISSVIPSNREPRYIF